MVSLQQLQKDRIVISCRQQWRGLEVWWAQATGGRPQLPDIHTRSAARLPIPPLTSQKTHRIFASRKTHHGRENDAVAQCREAALICVVKFMSFGRKKQLKVAIESAFYIHL